MKSITIIVFNYESLPFLRACIRQIRKYKHPEIEQKIIISEQSSESSYLDVLKEFENQEDITIVKMKAVCSGYAIDYIMRFIDIQTEYICTLDSDAFPIHKNWLYVCLKLIEENNFSFVGHHADTGVSDGRSCFEDAYSDYGTFFHVAQCFRVGKTKDFKYFSLNAGYTRAVSERNKIEFGFLNNQWADIANQKKLALGGYADSSVIANWLECTTTENNKFTFAETACLGFSEKEGRYGRVFDNIVFHLMFSSMGEEITQTNLGQNYSEWKNKINNGFTDELISEILSSVKPINIPRLTWNGKTKQKEFSSEELNKKINKFIK